MGAVHVFRNHAVSPPLYCDTHSVISGCSETISFELVVFA
jgi:hypothetical protein